MNATKILIVGNNYSQIKLFVSYLEKTSYFPIYCEWILVSSIQKYNLQNITSQLIIILDSKIQMPTCDINIAVFTFDTTLFSNYKYVHTFKSLEEICILIGKIYIKGGLLEKKKLDLTIQIPKTEDYIITSEELSHISTPINIISPVH